MMKKILLTTIATLCLTISITAQSDKIKMETIASADGSLSMRVINYGARIQSLKFDNTDVVLGFDTLENYAMVKQNFGAVVGRYIGRILSGKLKIDGQSHQLQVGTNGDCSHGGVPSFSQRYWNIVNKCDTALTLRYVSPDRENGFPGELTLYVTYILIGNSLQIDYKASTTKATVLNPSNHSFFNLSGDLGGDVLDEELVIYSDSIALYDTNKRVTGVLGAVESTPFDFRERHKIGERIDEDTPQLNVTKGYDHCYKLRDTESIDGLRTAARLYDSHTNIAMTVKTTEPTMQIYTANGHKGNIIGKEGKTYPRRNAICFETMHFPDSPNKPQWPSTLLRPGDTFHSTTIFSFDKR